MSDRRFGATRLRAGYATVITVNYNICSYVEELIELRSEKAVTTTIRLHLFHFIKHNTFYKMKTGIQGMSGRY